MMTAYRLHFEEANLDALKLVRSGKLGDLRYFSSDFSMQVTDPDNIRLKKETGGGPAWDIGIYCINAARTLFRAEPEEVFAYSAQRPGDKRFTEVPETVAVVMKFPEERFANFTCSFGADSASNFQLHGTKGSICVDNAYDYATPRKLEFTKDDKVVKTKNYRKADQFAPEILYFSNCVLNGKDPEPSALEGLNDVKVILAIYESAESGQPVRISRPAPHVGPNRGMKKRVRGHAEPELVNATGASN
jgi:glucose-fructose oxidoreductase